MIHHHEVVAGDSLWAIAQHYGTTVAAIQTANSWIPDINLIKPGWVLHVAAVDTTPEPEPEPEPATMLVGAAIDRTTVAGQYQSWAQARDAFEAALGKKVQILRRFVGAADIGKTWAQISTLASDTGYPQHISIKGTHSAAAWDQWLAGIPNDGQPRWITNHHEPEGDMSPEAFQAMQASMLAAIDRTGRDDLHPTIVVTTWWERDAASANTTSAVWFPPDIDRWTLGLDPYDISSTYQLAQIAGPTLDLWRQHGGTRWAISEVGTKRTGNGGAQWITAGLEWARGEGCEFVAYFHSPVGTNGPWWLDDPAMLAAYAAQIT